MYKITGWTALFMTLILAILGYFFYRDIVVAEFVVQDVDCVPRNYNIDEVTNSTVKISWKTTDECVSYLVYGESYDETDSLGTGEGGFIRLMNHEVSLSGLKPGSLYYMYISSGDVLYGKSGGGVQVKTLEY